MNYIIIYPISGSAGTRNPVVKYYCGGDLFLKDIRGATKWDLEDAKSITKRLNKEVSNKIFYTKNVK